MKYRILLVDDDTLYCEGMKRALELSNFLVTVAQSGPEAVSTIKFSEVRFAVALVDFNMPDVDGADTCRALRQADSDLQIIGLSGDDTVEAHSKTMLAGANSFHNKSIQFEKLISTIQSFCLKFEETTRTVDMSSFENSNTELISSLNIVGRSNHLAQVAHVVKKVASKNSTILIRGENGTGKEKIAQAIHKSSPRCNARFIAINCGAIPATLIESELFGHEKGSFTGATNSRKGLFEEANKGTIFLDEIGDMSLNLQVKLLRVLQEQEITPVGSSKSIKIDVRIIAATNINLEEAIANGNFREDLFYRINAIPINLLPLRKRPEDIEPLVAFFTDKYNKSNGTAFKFLASTVRKMEGYNWPGNIRELENTVSQLLTLAKKPVIQVNELDEKFFNTDASILTKDIMPYERFEKEQMSSERKFIERVLAQTKSIRQAAEKLQLSRSTLQNRLRILGIESK